MGANMTRRLLQTDHQVVAFDIHEENVREAEANGAEGAQSLEELVNKLALPRTVWIMVPSGDPVENTVKSLADLLEQGDIIIDGGNSNYNDTLRRGEFLKEKGIHMIDVGTSGGIWGLEQGYSMMVGGSTEAVKMITPALKSLAPGPDKGWGHVGPGGSGHYVKMIHNGIEYGLMEAYAEGFEIMYAKKEFELDLHQVAEIWRFGSVVRSWLLDLTAQALDKNPTMDNIKAFVPDSGEGRWTIFESIHLDVPAPVITLALQERLISRQEENFAAKLVAAMRHEFGGHDVQKNE